MKQWARHRKETEVNSKYDVQNWIYFYQPAICRGISPAMSMGHRLQVNPLESTCTKNFMWFNTILYLSYLTWKKQTTYQLLRCQISKYLFFSWVCFYFYKFYSLGEDSTLNWGQIILRKSVWSMHYLDVLRSSFNQFGMR